MRKSYGYTEDINVADIRQTAEKGIYKWLLLWQKNKKNCTCKCIAVKANEIAKVKDKELEKSAFAVFTDGNPKDEVKDMMTAVEDLRNTLDAKVVRLEEELEYTRAHLSKVPQYTQRIEFL